MTEKTLPLIYTDNTDQKKIARIAGIAKIAFPISVISVISGQIFSWLLRWNRTPVSKKVYR